MVFQRIEDILAAVLVLDRELALADPELVVDLVVVGGAAVLLLSDSVHVTTDIDVFQTTGLRSFSQLIGIQEWGRLQLELNLSTAADMFATQLPLDWEKRTVMQPGVSTERVRVMTLSPEDLAVMKIFRLNSKDAADIQALATSSHFDPELMRTLFLSALPDVIGRPEWHIQSFLMIWNSLYPDNRISADELVNARPESRTDQ